MFFLTNWHVIDLGVMWHVSGADSGCEEGRELPRDGHAAPPPFGCSGCPLQHRRWSLCQGTSWLTPRIDGRGSPVILCADHAPDW